MDNTPGVSFAELLDQAAGKAGLGLAGEDELRAGGLDLGPRPAPGRARGSARGAVLCIAHDGALIAPSALAVPDEAARRGRAPVKLEGPGLAVDRRADVALALAPVARGYAVPLGAALEGAQALLDWEELQRPPEWRLVSLADGQPAFSTLNMQSPEWKNMRGRCLVLLHGTFSSSEATFGPVPAMLQKLLDIYAGQVLAYNHPTMGPEPLENARQLVSMLPEDARLRFDLLTHSRGGLVARCLTELAAEIDFGQRKLKLERAVFVGAPNRGTRAADAKRYEHLVNLVLNAMRLAHGAAEVTLAGAGGIVADAIAKTMEALLRALKSKAVGTLARLPGVAAMKIGSDFLRHLNSYRQDTGDPRYFAVSANYTPHGWLRRIADAVFVDRSHDWVENDIVVPEPGVHSYNGARLFPVRDALKLGAETGVSHCTYFHDEAVVSQICTWLQRRG